VLVTCHPSKIVRVRRSEGNEPRAPGVDLCLLIRGPRTVFTKHSPLTIKAAPDGHVEGIAWSFAHAPDQVGDHILPTSFRFGETLPMLLEHRDQIGLFEKVSIDSDGLRVAGRIDKSTREGQEAAAKAADGELSGLSIGFSGEYQTSGTNRIFTLAELAEVSLVARPANTGARVTAVKGLTECQSIAEFEKSLKDRLGISRRQARAIANAAWPQFNPQDPDDIAGMLEQFSLTR